MKNEMVSLANNIQRHSKEVNNNFQVENVSKWVTDIRHKVPIVQNLEKRLNIMQGLDPVMDGILSKMQEVTDNSNLKNLQQQSSTEAEDQDATDDFASRIVDGADKESAIQNVLESTLRRID